MTPAEFATIRESLCLSKAELSRLMGVSERVVRAWEAGTETPSEVRCAQLLEWVKQCDLAAENFERQYVTLIKAHEKPSTVVLLRYRSDDYAAWNPNQFDCGALHNAVLMRCYMRALAMKLPIRIVMFDPEDYMAWLDSKQDSPAKRAEWASYQLS